MENAFIICTINLFTIRQKIIIVKTNEAEQLTAIDCDLNSLPQALVDLCFSQNIDKVHLYGDESYIEKCLQDIDYYSGCYAYSNNMIKVEVNK